MASTLQRPHANLTTSYWRADNSDPVLETTVGGILRDAAAAYPDWVALIEGTPDPATRRRWTYAELLTEAERVARALLVCFAPGEHLAVWAPNLPEWELLEFGAALAGVVLVTVNPTLRESELAYVLHQSRAAGIFFAPDYRGRHLLNTLESVRAGLPELRETLLFSEWDQFVASGSPTQVLPVVAPDDMAQIQYTSGTTGFPKGAMLHHRGIINSARFFARRAGLLPGAGIITCVPLFHTGGCVLGVLGAVHAHARHILAPGFEAGLVLNLIETERAAVVGTVPTMLVAMMEHPDWTRRDLSSLRAIVSGGAPVPAALVRQIEATLEVLSR